MIITIKDSDTECSIHVEPWDNDQHVIDVLKKHLDWYVETKRDWTSEDVPEEFK
jgi:hypothetical protein